MAASDGDALAAAVLLPPALVLPVDAQADALAASVLVPVLTSAPPAIAANATDDAGCCDRPSKPAAPRGAGCCQDAKAGDCCGDCGMPCCQSVPPTR
ncbi:MAG: hypothetical protein AB7Q16_08770 [Vicinamibacterales bacterium]